MIDSEMITFSDSYSMLKIVPVKQPYGDPCFMAKWIAPICSYKKTQMLQCRLESKDLLRIS